MYIATLIHTLFPVMLQEQVRCRVAQPWQITQTGNETLPRLILIWNILCKTRLTKKILAGFTCAWDNRLSENLKFFCHQNKYYTNFPKYAMKEAKLAYKMNIYWSQKSKDNTCTLDKHVISATLDTRSRSRFKQIY